MSAGREGSITVGLVTSEDRASSSSRAAHAASAASAPPPGYAHGCTCSSTQCGGVWRTLRPWSSPARHRWEAQSRHECRRYQRARPPPTPWTCHQLWLASSCPEDRRRPRKSQRTGRDRNPNRQQNIGITRRRRARREPPSGPADHREAALSATSLSDSPHKEVGRGKGGWTMVARVETLSHFGPRLHLGFLLRTASHLP